MILTPKPVPHHFLHLSKWFQIQCVAYIKIPSISHNYSWSLQHTASNLALFALIENHSLKVYSTSHFLYHQLNHIIIFSFLDSCNTLPTALSFHSWSSIIYSPERRRIWLKIWIKSCFLPISNPLHISISIKIKAMLMLWLEQLYSF